MPHLPCFKLSARAVLSKKESQLVQPSFMQLISFFHLFHIAILSVSVVLSLDHYFWMIVLTTAGLHGISWTLISKFVQEENHVIVDTLGSFHALLLSTFHFMFHFTFHFTFLCVAEQPFWEYLHIQKPIAFSRYQIQMRHGGRVTIANSMYIVYIQAGTWSLFTK